MKVRTKAQLAGLGIGIFAMGLAAGLALGPDETARGYRLGNEDGYSTGYNDGLDRLPHDHRRFMTERDYVLRAETGGRETPRRARNHATQAPPKEHTEQSPGPAQ